MTTVAATTSASAAEAGTETDAQTLPSTVPTSTPGATGAVARPGHVVCRVGEIPEGGRKIVQINNKSIGVFHLKGGRFYALLNLCPHQLAPLCAGKVTGMMRFGTKVGEYDWQREGEIVRCPWHAWEFDITTGRSIFNPHKVRTRAYPVSVAPPSIADEVTPGCDHHDAGHACSAGANDAELPAGNSTAQGTDAEAVESFPVSVRDNLIIVHI